MSKRIDHDAWATRMSASDERLSRARTMPSCCPRDTARRRGSDASCDRIVVGDGSSRLHIAAEDVDRALSHRSSTALTSELSLTCAQAPLAIRGQFCEIGCVSARPRPSGASAWFDHCDVLRKDSYALRLSITFAFVATHNHFVLDRGGKVFKQSAPVIKLPAGATRGRSPGAARGAQLVDGLLLAQAEQPPQGGRSDG